MVAGKRRVCPICSGPIEAGQHVYFSEKAVVRLRLDDAYRVDAATCSICGKTRVTIRYEPADRAS